MWTKIIKILCIYLTIRSVNSLKDICKFHKENDSTCIFTSTEYINNKSVNITQTLFTSDKFLRIESYSFIDTVRSEFQVRSILKPDEMKYVECLDNLNETILINCKKNLTNLIVNKTKSAHDIHIYQVEFKDDTTLDFYAQHFANLNILEWDMSEYCEPASKLFCKFKNLEHVTVSLGNLSANSNCEAIRLYCTPKIKEMILKIGENTTINIDPKRLSENILTSMESLQIFKGLCLNGTKIFPHILYNKFVNLSELVFENCHSVEINEESFQNLTNLKTLQFQKVNFIDLSFLRSETLRKNLECLEINELSEFKNFAYKHFLHDYKKLGFINFSVFGDSHGYKDFFLNISAFICRRWTNNNICAFIVDLNKRTCPDGCDCFLNYNKMIFNVSCNRYEALTYVPIPITGKASLSLENINLTTLPNNSLYGYSNLQELHLANNKLSHISVEQLPVKLSYLDLSNNNLRFLDSKVLKQLSQNSIRIRLSGNPWICSCEYQEMVLFAANHDNLIEDRHELKCKDENLGLMASLVKNDLCGNYTKIILFSLLGVAVAIIVVLFIVLFFKTRIAMWLYEHKVCLSCISQPESDQEIVQKIDAFLAFCHKDLGLIEEFVNKLENDPWNYKLCFYQRDWLIGESIAICIMKTIEDSKRIIILMTEHFVNSKWGHFEFRQAIRATSMDPTKRLLVIVYPEVKNFDKLDTELQLYMKYKTYLERNDPLFWRKLLFWMPHQRNEADPTDPLIEESPV